MDKVKKVVYTMICIVALLYCTCSTEEKTDLGGGYAFYPEHDHILGTILDVPPYIKGMDWNDRFIIVEQTPNGLIPNPIYDKIPLNYSKGLDSTYYWIIDKTKDKYWGPIEKEKFEDICKKESITDLHIHSIKLPSAFRNLLDH